MARATEVIVGQGFILNGCPVRIVEATTKKVKLAVGAAGVSHEIKMLTPQELLDLYSGGEVD